MELVSLEPFRNHFSVGFITEEPLRFLRDGQESGVKSVGNHFLCIWNRLENLRRSSCNGGLDGWKMQAEVKNASKIGAV